MFETKTQKQEYLELMTAVWEAPEIVPCTNFPDAYFPSLEKDALELANQAKQLCFTCPVINQCLSYAIKYEAFGVWGGTTANQRDLFRQSAGIKLPRYDYRQYGIDD